MTFPTEKSNCELEPKDEWPSKLPENCIAFGVEVDGSLIGDVADSAGDVRTVELALPPALAGLDCVGQDSFGARLFRIAGVEWRLSVSSSSRWFSLHHYPEDGRRLTLVSDPEAPTIRWSYSSMAGSVRIRAAGSADDVAAAAAAALACRPSPSPQPGLPNLWQTAEDRWAGGVDGEEVSIHRYSGDDWHWKRDHAPADELGQLFGGYLGTLQGSATSMAEAVSKILAVTESFARAVAAAHRERRSLATVSLDPPKPEGLSETEWACVLAMRADDAMAGEFGWDDAEEEYLPEALGLAARALEPLALLATQAPGADTIPVPRQHLVTAGEALRRIEQPANRIGELLVPAAPLAPLRAALADALAQAPAELDGLDQPRIAISLPYADWRAAHDAIERPGRSDDPRAVIWRTVAERLAAAVLLDARQALDIAAWLARQLRRLPSPPAREGERDLMAVLQPLAELADHYDRGELGPAYPIPNFGSHAEGRIRLGDLRAARELLRWLEAVAHE